MKPPFATPCKLQRATFIALILVLLCTLTWLVSAPSRGQAQTPERNLAAVSVQATPIFCQGFYRGDTRGGVNQISSYPCRPDWPETGPEHIYSLTTTFTQTLSLKLSHAVQQDLDLFLLSATGPAQCYFADASLKIAELAPADYLIYVDGFQGSQGTYHLEVGCDEPPLATPTPTDAPSPTATATPTATPTATLRPTATPTRQHLNFYAYLPAQAHAYPLPTPQPTTLVLQQGMDGYEGLIDSYLNDWDSAINYAKVERLAVRQPDIMNPLLRFSLDGLPANAHIVEAKLGLWSLAQSNSNPATIGLYKLNRPWNETAVTWQQATASDSWGIGGANAIPADRSGSATSTQLVDATTVWYEWDLTTMAQSWLADPATNHGMILKAFAEPRVLYHFASGEWHNPAARPRLTIRYWTPALASTDTPNLFASTNSLDEERRTHDHQ